MKRCPTCGKEFEDAMKFCQVDGTPLVDAEPPLDPYATMVGRPIEAAPSEPSAGAPAEPVFEAQPEEPAPIAPPENILDLPEADPLKTMYVSEAELHEVMGSSSESAPEPEPPSFTSPEPPPSPFSTSQPEATPAPPPFEEPATVMSPPQFDTPPPAPPAEWTPPPAPEPAWQNQQVGSNTPFQPPAVGGVNQTLPIVSLVLGIISICCYISPLTGLAALITGYLGMKNANNDPQNYGGKGLAMAGMIVGGIFFLIGVAYYVIIILMYAGIIAGSVLQGF
jgi:hypothetical protein